MLMFIMQVTAAVLLNVSAINCNFLYGNCHYDYTRDYLCYVTECSVCGDKQQCGYVLEYYSALSVCLSQLMFVILPYIYC